MKHLRNYVHRAPILPFIPFILSLILIHIHFHSFVQLHTVSIFLRIEIFTFFLAPSGSECWTFGSHSAGHPEPSKATGDVRRDPEVLRHPPPPVPEKSEHRLPRPRELYCRAEEGTRF